MRPADFPNRPIQPILPKNLNGHRRRRVGKPVLRREGRLLLAVTHGRRRFVLLPARPALKLHHPFVVGAVGRVVALLLPFVVVVWVQRTGVRPPLAALVVVRLAVVAWVSDFRPVVQVLLVLLLLVHGVRRKRQMAGIFVPQIRKVVVARHLVPVALLAPRPLPSLVSVPPVQMPVLARLVVHVVQL